MTVDVVEFCLARLAEEEADALAATQEPWSLPWPGKPFIQIGGLGGAVVGQGPWNPGMLAADAGDVAHMVRQQPAATLARVAALRALVTWATEPYAMAGGPAARGATDAARREVLCHVANIWPGHPDFDPRWVL